MDHVKEQEAARQRMRELLEHREAAQASVSRRHKPIFKTPAQEAEEAKRHEMRFTKPKDPTTQQQEKDREQAHLLHRLQKVQTMQYGEPLSENAWMRTMRDRSSLQGKKPVFNENIWTERKGTFIPEEPVSPKTQVDGKWDEGAGSQQDGLFKRKKDDKENTKNTSEGRRGEKKERGNKKPGDGSAFGRKKQA